MRNAIYLCIVPLGYLLCFRVKREKLEFMPLLNILHFYCAITGEVWIGLSKSYFLFIG
jgi:hypothetical protein